MREEVDNYARLHLLDEVLRQTITHWVHEHAILAGLHRTSMYQVFQTHQVGKPPSVVDMCQMITQLCMKQFGFLFLPLSAFFLAVDQGNQS